MQQMAAVDLVKQRSVKMEYDRVRYSIQAIQRHKWNTSYLSNSDCVL